MKRLITCILFMGLLMTFTASCNETEVNEEPYIITPVLTSVSARESLRIIIRDNTILYPEPKVISTKEVEEEYPVARYIWDFLQDLGYNDYVCAGIIGNMMVEAGGQTLAIQVDAASSTHYGICQWSKKYYSSVIGVSLDAQCEFLRDNIEYEINAFGYKYAQGFNYNKFLGLTNERDCALAFAKAYERCGSGYYTHRQNCATTAYNYFVNGVIG